MKQKLQSRFAAMRVRPAHRDYWRSEPHPEEWLLIEWPVRRIRTHQVLAIHPAARHWSPGTGAHGQTSLDHRTGLSGTEAGTRVGPLRRTGLARLSSSRHLMHRGLWIPGGRTESFFPLSPYRQSWTTSPRTAAGLPAAWLAAFVPSGIIRASITTLRMVLARLPARRGSLTAPFVGRAPADPRRRCPPRSRKWLDGNGSARFSRHRPTVSLGCSFSSTMQRQFAGDPRSQSALTLLRRIDSRAPSSWPALFGPICGDKTAEGGLIDRSDSVVCRHGRPDQPINVLHRLDLRPDNTHPTPQYRRHTLSSMLLYTL